MRRLSLKVLNYLYVAKPSRKLSRVSQLRVLSNS